MNETPAGDEIAGFLADIWMEDLGVDQIEMEDDFFALGGNSLLAITMLVNVSSRVEAELEYDQFFDDPRFSTLVSLIRQAGGPSRDPSSMEHS